MSSERFVGEFGAYLTILFVTCFIIAAYLAGAFWPATVGILIGTVFGIISALVRRAKAIKRGVE